MEGREAIRIARALEGIDKTLKDILNIMAQRYPLFAAKLKDEEE